MNGLWFWASWNCNTNHAGTIKVPAKECKFQTCFTIYQWFPSWKLLGSCLCWHVSPQHPSRFRSLRKRHVKAMALNPRAKPRHETVDVKLYVKKSSSRYVDFRQDWSKSLNWAGSQTIAYRAKHIPFDYHESKATVTIGVGPSGMVAPALCRNVSGSLSRSTLMHMPIPLLKRSSVHSVRRRPTCWKKASRSRRLDPMISASQHPFVMLFWSQIQSKPVVNESFSVKVTEQDQTSVFGFGPFYFGSYSIKSLSADTYWRLTLVYTGSISQKNLLSQRQTWRLIELLFQTL